MQITNTPLLLNHAVGQYEKKNPERLPIVLDAEPAFELATGELLPSGEARDPKTAVVPASYAVSSQQARFIRTFSSEQEPSTLSQPQATPTAGVKLYLQVAEGDNDERGIFIDEKV